MLLRWWWCGLLLLRRLNLLPCGRRWSWRRLCCGRTVRLIALSTITTAFAASFSALTALAALTAFATLAAFATLPVATPVLTALAAFALLASFAALVFGSGIRRRWGRLRELNLFGCDFCGCCGRRAG